MTVKAGDYGPKVEKLLDKMEKILSECGCLVFPGRELNKVFAKRSHVIQIGETFFCVLDANTTDPLFIESGSSTYTVASRSLNLIRKAKKFKSDEELLRTHPDSDAVIKFLTEHSYD